MMLNNWACNKLWEKRYKKSVLKKIFLRRFGAINFSQITDLLESEERDREWQKNACFNRFYPIDFANAFQQKRCVFEKGQQKDIEYHTHDKCRATKHCCAKFINNQGCGKIY